MLITNHSLLSIEGIENLTIIRYFDSLNQGNFQETAQLFSNNGVLYPPFEDGVIGKAAIADYLNTEAKGLQLYPKEGKVIKIDENYQQIEVKGKVKTPLFGVNVSWNFVINSLDKIESVEVKLLASLPELLKLKSQ
jgi:hypothetical protein